MHLLESLEKAVDVRDVDLCGCGDALLLLGLENGISGPFSGLDRCRCAFFVCMCVCVYVCMCVCVYVCFVFCVFFVFFVIL